MGCSEVSHFIYYESYFLTVFEEDMRAGWGFVFSSNSISMGGAIQAIVVFGSFSLLHMADGHLKVF